MAITETLSRIKWGAVAVVIIAIIIILAVYTKFNPFSGITTTLNPVYKGTEDLKMRSGANPDTIGIDEKSTIWVEIKNTGEKEHNVLINLTTYDEKIRFLRSDSRSINESIKIGPLESRKLEFKVKLFDVKYGGNYGIDITVKSDKNFESIKDVVFLHVTSPKE